ncbi:MAG: hypothetical protein ABMA13_18340 [Chthoniobacteraceae bacterium]
MNTAAFDRATVLRIQHRCGAKEDGDFGRATLQAVDETLALVERTVPALIAGRRVQTPGTPVAPSPSVIPSEAEGPVTSPFGPRIVIEAARYLGLTEIVGNRKWDLPATPGPDPIADELLRVLIEAGWQPGWPYCAAFVEAVFRAVYRGHARLAEIAAVLTPHCLTSWRNAKLKGWITREPCVGAIGVMQLGTGESGHEFIVAKLDLPTVLRTIEANTSATPGTVEADRNGDGIFRKTRALDFRVTSGLHLLGFIRPPGL